jgi:hypothetical protein
MFFGVRLLDTKRFCLFHLLDGDIRLEQLWFLIVFDNCRMRFRTSIAVWAFLKAEPTIAFNCQYQCRSLARVAYKHMDYLTL